MFYFQGTSPIYRNHWKHTIVLPKRDASVFDGAFSLFEKA